MKLKFLIIPLALLAACKAPVKEETVKEAPLAPIQGTWQLVSAISVTKGDSVVTYPVKGVKEEMIKMLNGDHFAFLRHNVKGSSGKRSYDSGGGTYTLEGDNYKENLQYYSNSAWEGQSFNFKVTFKGDTLVQKGIEKIDSLKINHEIIETYIRIKK
ncbi:lipocalin-like domain-containing protein [Mucilaginibacter glaciei]|uniref:Lipocalin family protein n=1 Tax=Mucilaginibacter glaciei TaxID=2772109 RepID=A0A926NMR9_9SPHI|nr:lipocalin family protein [Mucilaginibacter glaciei]MBD1392566.1 lipocalin family protein [Mucilaginibacter glaciei]